MMRTTSPWRLGRLLALVVFASMALVHAGSGVTFSGGDGSSFEKAVVIKGATEETGVAAEYAYLAKQFPGCKMGQQSLMQKNGKAYDLLEITTKGGERKAVYFDISDFFGKF